MPMKTDQALVLRLSDYSESSQIATLFCAEGGQVRVIAKGARRGTKTRVAVGLDLLELGDVGYHPPRSGAELGTLAEWVQRDTFSGLRRSLPSLLGGLYAAELTAAMTEPEDPHPELFDRLQATLAALAVADAASDASSAGAHVVAFQLKLLQSVGYVPNFRTCCGCGRPRVRGTPAWFDSAAGGLICEACGPRFPHRRRIAAELVDTRLEASPPGEWFDLFDAHATCILGRRLHSARQFNALLRADAAERAAPTAPAANTDRASRPRV